MLGASETPSSSYSAAMIFSPSFPSILDQNKERPTTFWCEAICVADAQPSPNCPGPDFEGWDTLAQTPQVASSNKRHANPLQLMPYFFGVLWWLFGLVIITKYHQIIGPKDIKIHPVEMFPWTFQLPGPEDFIDSTTALQISLGVDRREWMEWIFLGRKTCCFLLWDLIFWGERIIRSTQFEDFELCFSIFWCWGFIW